VDPIHHIFGYLEKKPFELRKWFSENLVGILGTICFHFFLFILFLLFKIHSLSERRDLEITLDLSQNILDANENISELSKLTPAEVAYLERILSQSSNMNNMASNIAERLDKEISTKNYVDKVQSELDQNRSEEWRKQQEEIQNKLNKEDFIPEYTPETREMDIDEYTGLTNITYEFLQAPVNRIKVYLPVPVYKCQGAGTVSVEITVDQSGKVQSAKAFAQQDFPDRDCILDVAEKYALRSRFEGALGAPKSHRAKIIYNFIAQ
jgi:hypothetical protein